MLLQPSSDDPGPSTATRDDDPSPSAPYGSGDFDFFSSLGSQRVKPAPVEKPDPEKLHISSRELNTQLVQGKGLDEYSEEPKKDTKYGAPGYQWRMMKLRKTYELAEKEGRSVEEVALERYGDMGGFEEAKRERTWLDGRQKGPAGSAAAKRPVNNPLSTAGTPMSSQPASRTSSFRKPGESAGPSTPSSSTPAPPISTSRPTGIPSTSAAAAAASRSSSNTPRSSQPSTPIPSVLAPPKVPLAAGSSEVVEGSNVAAAATPPMDSAALNKLEARVLKAEMSGKPNAASLREKLEREKQKAQNTAAGDRYSPNSTAQRDRSGNETEIAVLPTLDARGRLYDVGTSKSGESAPAPHQPGNRRKRVTNNIETHDPLTGEVIRREGDDDTLTLSELVRQEKFKAGRGDQKDFDAEFAAQIAGDGAYKGGEDYLDENAERLARRRMKSDALKRQFAVDDYAKTRKAMESCRLCFRGEDGDLAPLTHSTIVAQGTRAYLALPEYQGLVQGHALIVPVQHHLSSLEADDDTWEEVKNFAKCLLQLAAQRGETYVFWETVTSLKAQRHTYIEAVPLSRDLVASELPGSFRTELMQSGSEWDAASSKLITFDTARPFRRSMVSQLPYFAVLFDHKGEKGYGHVIQGPDAGDVLEAAGKGGADEGDGGYAMDELGDKGRGGGKFEKWFGAEIVGNLLDLEPQMWRKPRRLAEEEKRRVAAAFRQGWEPFDWTKLLREGASKAGA